MADALRKKRITEKSTFTRSVKKLIKIFDTESPMTLVEEQFAKVKSCYDKLETTHNEYLMAADIDIEDGPDGLAYIRPVQVTRWCPYRR